MHILIILLFVTKLVQTRIHHSQSSDFYVYAKTTPIIEFCTNVRFAPYGFSYGNRETDFKLATFDLQQGNQWDQVKDFNWLKSTPSPNWTVLPLEQRVSHDHLWKKSQHSVSSLIFCCWILCPVSYTSFLPKVGNDYPFKIRVCSTSMVSCVTPTNA